MHILKHIAWQYLSDKYISLIHIYYRYILVNNQNNIIYSGMIYHGANTVLNQTLKWNLSMSKWYIVLLLQV